MERYKNFASDIGLMGLANAINNLKSFLIIPVLTKLLGPSDYGAWTQLKVTLTLVAPFLTLGTGQAIIRFLAGESDKDKVKEDFFSCFFAASALSLVLAVACLVFSKTILIWVFGSSAYADLVNILAVLMILETCNILLLEYFKAFRYIKTYFKTLLAETVLEFGLIVYAVLGGYGVFGAALAMLVTRLLFVLVRIGQVYLNTGFALPRFKHFKKYVAYGVPLILSVTFFFVLNWSNRYLINYFLGLREVGIYSVAFFLAYTISFVTAPIAYILFPTLSGCVNRSEIGEARTYLNYSLKYYFFFGIPLIFVMSFLPKELLSFISTSDFLSAAAYLPLLAIASFVLQIAVIGEYVNRVFNKNMLLLVVYLVLAVLNVILNLILIPMMGVMGSALAMLICFAAYAFFSLIYCQRFIRFGIDMKMLGKIVFSSIIMVATFYIFRMSARQMSVVYIAPAALVSYLVSAFLFGFFSDKEIALFRSFLRSKKVTVKKD